MSSTKITTIILVVVMIGVAIITCNPSLSSTPSTQVITILHTNDIHSQVTPVAQNKGKWAGYGGFAKIAHVVDSIRSRAGEVLLLSCGDFCQGTPFFNFYKGDVEIDFMNKLGYNATTLGNHEFDNGTAALARLAKRADFPFITSNYDLTASPLDSCVVPYTIIDFKGVKVGLFGLTVNTRGMVEAENCEGTAYKDPITSAQTAVDSLRAKGAQLVICLSHLGEKSNEFYMGDDTLAAKTSGIDVILGGHSHTEGISTVKNKDGKDVTISQAGSQGRLVGRVDVTISRE
ncbi:MAG: metallophosphatase [Flavobacteriales bacterium]|nr:metallophosphatase [Flavobacteriales bacterium]